MGYVYVYDDECMYVWDMACITGWDCMEWVVLHWILAYRLEIWLMAVYICILRRPPAELDLPSLTTYPGIYYPDVCTYTLFVHTWEVLG